MGIQRNEVIRCNDRGHIFRRIDDESSAETNCIGSKSPFLGIKRLTAKDVAEELGGNQIRFGMTQYSDIQSKYPTIVGLKSVLNLTNAETVQLFFDVTERARDKGGRDKGL